MRPVRSPLPAVLVAVAALAAGGLPATASASSGAGSASVPAVGLVAPAAQTLDVGPRYPAEPPAGITCRTVSRGSVGYECVVGRSVRGRPIIVTRQGDAAAARVVLVSGQMHGEEWPGPLVVDRVRRLSVPATAGYQLWTVRTMNPDGGARGQRRNARGVDLNMQFDARWRRTPYSGRAPFTQPEARAMKALLEWVQPDVVISLHGFSESVDTTGGGRRAAAARTFSRLTNVGPATVVRCTGGPCHGNMTDWYTAVSTVGGVAFTVEMPRSSLQRRTCRVPGHLRRLPVVLCAAYAARHMAATR